MQSISDIIKLPEKAKGSERNSVLRDIYMLYEKDEFRKIENWKRYRRWCESTQKSASLKESQDSFRKDRSFIKTFTPKQIAIKLAHIPTKDLYYLRSECRDRANRKESVGGYLLGSIKVK